MDVGAISGNHQGLVVIKEALLGGVDGNVSTIFKKDASTFSHIVLVLIIILLFLTLPLSQST